MDQGECTDSPRVVHVCDRACPLSGGETHGPAGGRSKCPIPCSSRCRCMHVMRVSCRAGCRRGRSAGRASRDPSFRARGASQGRVMSNKQASQLPSKPAAKQATSLRNKIASFFDSFSFKDITIFVEVLVPKTKK